MESKPLRKAAAKPLFPDLLDLIILFDHPVKHEIQNFKEIKEKWEKEQLCKGMNILRI